MNQQTAYPLSWPAGWPRTQVREKARFQTTLPAALNMLKKECNLLGGTNLILSSNCTLGDENPRECGVVAYFQLKKQSIAIPCDRWNSVKDNVKAIALTIEAMRGMERWGAKHMITAMFQGFMALSERTGPSCWEVLGVAPQSSEATIMEAYRAKAQTAHPDKGGSHEAFVELNQAKDIALASIR